MILKPDLETRISILETEMKYVKSSIEEVKDNSSKTYETVLSLKERLDKQNGLLPHMSEDLRDLYTKFDRFEHSYGKSKLQQEASRMRLNMIWGVGGFFLSAIALEIINWLSKLPAK